MKHQAELLQQMHSRFHARALCKHLKGPFSKGSSKVICKKKKFNENNRAKIKWKMYPTTHAAGVLVLRRLFPWFLYGCLKLIIHLRCFSSDANGLEEFCWQVPRCRKLMNATGLCLRGAGAASASRVNTNCINARLDVGGRVGNWTDNSANLSQSTTLTLPAFHFLVFRWCKHHRPLV